MTKQLLILAYIATVLVISSLVRADSAVVNQAVINPNTGIMNIAGGLSTPCENQPTVVVDQIDQNQNIVKLNVTTLSPKGIFCTDVISGSFDASYDLKELSLNAGKTYKVIFNDYQGQQPFLQYTAQKAQGNFDAYKTNKESLKGLLIALASDVSGFALKTQDQTIPVVSPDMDLSPYQNSQVWISGYAVNTASMDSSQDSLALSSQGQTIVVPVSISVVKTVSVSPLRL